MKTRNLILLLLLLVVVAASAYLVVHHGGSVKDGKVENSPLFPRLPVNEIASIEIRSSREQVTCVKKNDRWVISERSDYPADFNKITALLMRLRDVRTARVFEAGDETLRRLGMKAPEDTEAKGEEKGLRVVLGDGKGEALAQAIVNSARGPSSGSPTPAGRHVRLGNESLVRVLLDEQRYFAWSAAPTDWLERVIVKVPAGDIRRISCTAAAGGPPLYALSRGFEDEPLKSELPLPGELSPIRLNQVARAISPLGIEDVLRADSAPPAPEAFPFQIDYELFDGRVFRVHTSQGSASAEPFTVRVEERPSGGNAAEGGTEAREDLGRWVFKLPVSKHIAFIVRPDELLGNLPGEANPQLR